MSKLEIKSTLWLVNSNGHLLGPGKKKLLETIKKTGSIKSAAKEMKMSYRHAWNMTSSMNLINSKPVIEKMVGGKNGGGTILTKEGENLIKIYDRISSEFEKLKLTLKETI